MRIVNGIIYITIFLIFIISRRDVYKKGSGAERVSCFIKGREYLLLVLVVFNTLSFAMTFQKEQENIFIKRSDYSGRDQSISVVLNNGEETKEETLKVERRRLSKEQQEERMREAFDVMEQTLPGENASLKRIETNLNFDLDQEIFPFDVDFVPEDYSLINGEGYVKNEKEELKQKGYTEDDFKKGITTKVTVTLWYGSNYRIREYPLLIFPKSKTEEEQRFEKVMEQLKEEEQKSVHEEGFSLPSVIEGIDVSLSKNSLVSPGYILIFGICLVLLLLLRERENEKQKEKVRLEKLRKSYPWFVNEMLLLMGAGMQVKHIFAMMIRELGERENSEDDRIPLIQEITRAKLSMENGMGEEQVYYQLGRRLKLPCYIKLMTLLEQNVTRGTKGLSAIFETEEMAALEERKNLAKRYGEEAGTKLLGPMILLLLVVMLIIMVPAFLGFSV